MPQIGGFRGGTRNGELISWLAKITSDRWLNGSLPSWPILAAGRTAVMTSATAVNLARGTWRVRRGGTGVEQSWQFGHRVINTWMTKQIGRYCDI